MVKNWPEVTYLSLASPITVDPVQLPQPHLWEPIRDKHWNGQTDTKILKMGG